MPSYCLKCRKNTERCFVLSATLLNAIPLSAIV